MRSNTTIPLTTLFKVDANSPYYHEEQKGTVFYAESWALTHYLLVTDRQQKTNKLGDYMELLSRHEDPVAAAEKAFGDLKKLQSNLDAYIHAARYNQFILSSAAARIDESTFKASPLTQTQADAVRADVLANNQRSNDARALLNEVLKADPNNVQAHETMGYLEFRDGNLDSARKWYGEAVKLDSQSYRANYYFATMTMGRAGKEEEKEVETCLRAAIRLNPRFAPAYDRLAALYGARRENLDEAHMLNLQAIELEPGNLGYRINAANVLMAMDRYADATNALRTSLKLAKQPSELAMVQSRIAQIEKIQTAHAQESANAAQQRVVQVNQTLKIVETAPKHPTESANGPKHEALGAIKGVK